MMAGPRPRVSRDGINLIFRLCEGEAVVTWHTLDRHFDGLGEELIAAGALVETAPSEIIIMPLDDDELYEFEWEPELEAYATFHPTMGWVKADPRARLRYRVSFEWLLGAMAGQLGLAAPARPTCLVPEALWDLGDGWFGKRRAAVLFGRRLAKGDTLDAICDALTRRVGRPPGILLTTSPPISRHVAIPGQHRVVCLLDCRRAGGTGLALDAEIVGGVLNGLRPQRPARLIDPSPDFRVVRALGQTFHFKRGEQQRRIIEYMYQRWLDGDDRVSVAEIIAELDLPERTRMRDTFKRHPAWRVLLTEEDGSLRFLV
jgi:hypothetical protein